MEEFFVVQRDTPGFQHDDVLVQNLDSSLLDSDVFLSVLEHVPQLLDRELLIHLGFVLDLFGPLPEAEGRARFLFVEGRW